MVEVRSIIEQNKWWKFGREFHNFDIDLRKLKEKLIQFKRLDLVLEPNFMYILYGPRRSGKTTWIKRKILKILENKPRESVCYYPCDALIAGSRRELRKILDYFLKKVERYEKSYIFLDEINAIEGWAYEIKSLIDMGKLEKSCLLVTGSPFTLKRQAELLPGRKIKGRYFFKPLSFRDFILNLTHLEWLTQDYERRRGIKKLIEKLRNLKISLEDSIYEMSGIFDKITVFYEELNFLFEIYLNTGGFPEIIDSFIRSSDFGREPMKLEPNFYKEFIEVILSDIMKQGKDENIAKQILKAIATKIGTSYNFRSISKETEEGISTRTVIDYLKLFEDIFFTYTINSFDISRKERRAKGKKKIYFTDTFILYSMLSYIYGKEGFELTQELLQDEIMRGKIIENLIAIHLALTKEEPIMKPYDSYLWFYYDKIRELDFVYKRENGKLLGVEVKHKLKKFRKVDAIKEYILLSASDEFEIGRDTMIVPIPIFLALLEKSDSNF